MLGCETRCRGCRRVASVASVDEDPVDDPRPVTIEDGVVTRPAGPWSPTVHDFLRHLRARGLTCVPEPLGVADGMERLVHIEGDSGGDGWRHQHSEAGLRSAAALLRRIHDASLDWSPPPDGVLQEPVAVVGEGEAVWCHGDVGPWNMVWHDGEAVALIDWDFLHRAPRVDDVAYALQWFAPARDDELALTWHHFPEVPDRAARVHSFLDAYGDLPPFDVPEVVARRMEATMALELRIARAGVEPQRTWVAEGSQERAAAGVRWVRDHAELLRP
ncbi:phosphotransferase enzyme family protein [Nocardioides zeicaulis]